MLDLSELLVAWAAPMFVGIRVTVRWQLDRFNDRTSRPIPVASA
jgi:hypothetical protein